MTKVLLVLSFLMTSIAYAQKTMPMKYKEQEIVKMIEDYSKATGEKFIVDSGVRGKASIFIEGPVTIEEAFHHLSSAVALNGFAISKQGDTFIVGNARNIQRSLLEVSTTKPTLKPERMFTWIYTAKNIPVTQINREIRIFSSKDGEMSVNAGTNQLIFSDWTSNIHRVSNILAEIDQKADPATARLIELSKKEQLMNKKENSKSKETQN